ncbi:uncharacterized protein LOC103313419 [Tribolium castaneum]|uniref:MD-2-related lipid-recognition domain-containing protein n=1 Tax=Tribolium castaneum TaxID=7070 RepID=D2A694_TRICA|nr:PREDICTED: uncharacterized protein LOC103313419 [Tribolium castaneum]EFA05480.2 hypothetical protein TcasGA2_TC015664 [Tribolium castaneum]|eukprot:XP_008194850.1 PREDICTED: uncharacterized protein LOC103313419 [Tribolium castaneum]
MPKAVVILCVVYFSHLAFPAFMKNRYVVEVENVLACPNNKQIGSPIRNIKFLRYNRTHKSLTYDFTYSRLLDEKIGGSVTVERWGDGGWIGIPFMGFQPNICSYVLRFFGSVWVQFHRSIGIKHPDKCPIPAGNYSVKDFVIDASEISVPFWSGRFKFTTTFQDVDTRRTIYCLIYIIKITEVF